MLEIMIVGSLVTLPIGARWHRVRDWRALENPRHCHDIRQLYGDIRQLYGDIRLLYGDQHTCAIERCFVKKPDRHCMLYVAMQIVYGHFEWSVRLLDDCTRKIP